MGGASHDRVVGYALRPLRTPPPFMTFQKGKGKEKGPTASHNSTAPGPRHSDRGGG